MVVYKCLLPISPDTTIATWTVEQSAETDDGEFSGDKETELGGGNVDTAEAVTEALLIMEGIMDEVIAVGRENGEGEGASLTWCSDFDPDISLTSIETKGDVSLYQRSIGRRVEARTKKRM